MTKEIWKDIKGYEGEYQISNKGRVKSLDRDVVCKNGMIKKVKGNIRKLNYTGYYPSISLRHHNQIYRIHRLVAKAFIPNPRKLYMVNHKDGNKTNNCADNLEWCTAKENVRHAIKNGLINNNGENSSCSKLKKKDVLVIHDRVAKGDKWSVIAKDYDVSTGSVFMIASGKGWKHLNLPKVTNRGHINDEIALDIWNRIRSGESKESVMKYYNVGESVVREVSIGKTYKHLNLPRLYSRLLKDEIEEIYLMEGQYRDIANKFRIPTYMVNNIKHNKSYAHITENLQ